MKEMKIIDGKIRFWHGIINPVPDGLRSFKIGFCILKPDLIRRGLKKEIIDLLTKDMRLCVGKNIHFNKDSVFELYPGFHEPEWAKNLVDYLLSGESCALVFDGPNVIEELLNHRNYIRKLYGQSSGNIINLIHAADSFDDAMREALIFFEEEEIVNAITKNGGE